MDIKKLLLVPTLLFGLYRMPAQITITKTDMPDVNDNIVISVNTGLSGFHADSTGPNYTWDWSNLIPDSQRYVKFESPLNTPYAILAFNSTYGIKNYTPDLFPWSLLGSTPTDAYYFYKNSTTAFNCVAEPLTAGGTAIPLPYTSVDRIYKFPLNYLDKDSSNMLFQLPNIPGLGTYAKKQKRVNEVDGWGTLITPYGTFDVVRVKSTLTITDSVYIDTVSFGFSIPRPIAYEFKWLANGGKIPILEIDATSAGGNNVIITRANWKDSLLVTPTVDFTEKSSCPIASEGSLTANPTGLRYPLTYQWSNGQTTQTISNLSPGTYSVTIKDRYGRVSYGVDSVKVLKDVSCINIPTAFTPDGDGVNDVWKIRSLNEYVNCKVEIFNQWGSLVFKSTGYGMPWDGRYNGDPVPAGAYYYIIDLGNNSKNFTGTVTIIR